MKKAPVLCALGALVIAGSVASPAFASWDYYFFRCQADQLGMAGAPAASTSNLARARREWSKQKMLASPHVQVGQSDPDYWQPSLDGDVTTAWNLHQIELYPVYERKGGSYGTGIWIGPGPHAPVGDLRYATTYSGIMSVGSQIGKPYHSRLAGLCEAGCYTPDQKLRYGLELVPIGEAYKEARRDVVTLAPEATFDALAFMVNKVARYTVDKEDADQELVILRMQSGGELKVTLEHPLLVPDGSLRAARELSAGDSLVRESGESDSIVSVERVTWFGKAYNLRPVTSDLTSNILVAQGYLNGSARFQNEYVTYMNRVILRLNIPESALPQ